ncbi:sulfatase-like hydrolase/transferase [Psychromonas sp. KJ10-2]|uniref:sulfatase-like hydrolase/transferase n=1 Tax=Psychromonas sp. KJ10-2 TaxID=3391822 RepID=UPI0039B624B9
MPNLQAISEQAINFKNHFSGANNSAQGVFSLFYGLPNSYWDPITDNHIAPVLMDKVVESNRSIGLFSSIGFVHPEFLQSSFSHLKQQADVYYSDATNNNQVMQQWDEWIKTQQQSTPWFAYVYLEQQNDHLFTQPSIKTIPEQTEQLTLYQSQVLAIDEKIQTIVDSLKAQQAYQNTIIILTGTNGQSFKEQNSNDTLISGASVPMVVVWPNKPPRAVYHMTSHVDLVPTLMQEVFAVDNPSNQFSSGHDLFTKQDRDFILSGDSKNYIIYENRRITKFSGNGDIDSIDWQGNYLEQNAESDALNITLLIDVLSRSRRFNQK